MAETQKAFTTKVGIIEVTGEEKIGKNQKPYTLLIVDYINDKMEEKTKRILAFTDLGKKLLSIVEEGQYYNVTLEKGEKYWEWKDINSIIETESNESPF
jgi:hypothetical protein